MLASYPQTHPYPTQHQQTFHHSDLPSPSTSNLPLYYTSAFGSTTHTPSPQQYRLPDVDAFGRPQLMTSTSHQQTPVRVQRTSATPQPQAMTDKAVPALSWQCYDDGSLQSTGNSRKTHQRMPSGSSVGSAGPASPFSSAASNPFIAHSDSSLSPSGVDAAYYEGLHSEHRPSLDLSSKPLPSRDASDSFLAPAFQNYNPTHDAESNMEARVAMMQALKEQHASADDGSPAPGLATPGRPQSSVGHRSPATPRTHVDELEDAPKPVSNNFRNAVPSLDRTMSEIYQDELYNPLGYGAAQEAPQTSQKLLSPYRSVFNERIQAANTHHLQSSQSPTLSSGDRSPFRQGSPYAPSQRTLDARAPQAGVGSAARLREQQKADDAAQALSRAQSQRQTAATPNTISPKDALLDFTASDDDAKMPLFPQSDSHFGQTQADLDRMALSDVEDADTTSQRSFGSFGSMTTSRRQSAAAYNPSAGFSFAPPSVPGGIQIPSQYPFVAQRRRPAQADSTPEFPAHLTSMDSSVSEVTAPEPSGDVKRPARTSADTGTYTCTYHGCTLRFETPAQLQKHKREGHRQAATTTAPVLPSEVMTSDGLLFNSQAGPHKCERTNPSTGKPCNAIFSRPYDLTRHEDTIHNARKQKVRCQLCTEEKSFSRNDALTRHMRVVHPEVDFGGRSRRRHV